MILKIFTKLTKINKINILTNYLGKITNYKRVKIMLQINELKYLNYSFINLTKQIIQINISTKFMNTCWFRLNKTTNATFNFVYIKILISQLFH